MSGDAETTMSVLLMEDETGWAELVIRSVEVRGGRVMHAHDGAACLSAAGGAERYDVIVLDRAIGSEPDEGLRVLRSLRSREVDAPVLMLTHALGPARAAQALDEGADDYLGKPFDAQELAARLGALVRRSTAAGSGPRVRVFGALELRLTSRVAYLGEARLNLAEQSFEILRLLVEAQGELVSRRALWAHVWPEWRRVGPRGEVIDTALSRLRRELRSVSPSDQSILTVPGGGYRLAGAAAAL